MKNDLTGNWRSFCRSIQEFIDDGQANPDFFARQIVKWCGTIDNVELDPDSPSAVINMPPFDLRVSDSLTERLDYVVLPIASDNLSQWNNVKQGDEVAFSAELGSGGPFPAVECRVEENEAVLMIRLWNGRLIDSSTL